MLEQLKVLDLSGSFLVDSALHVLSHHEALEVIKLRQCENAALITAHMLASIPTLHTIDLTSCFRIDDRCMHVIASLPRLQTLKLSCA